MSQRQQSGGRQHGFSRSSSTSSTSSSSSTPPQRHRRKRHPRVTKAKSRSRSRSQSSSGSTSADYNTPPRSRSNELHYQNKRLNRNDDEVMEGYRKETQQESIQAIVDADAASSDAPTDCQHVDDSIRSDKSSKTATNGGHDGESADDMSQRLDAFKGQRVCTTSTNQTAKPSSSKVLNARLKGIQFGKPGTVVRPGIQMKLAQPKPPTEKAKKITVASAFNNDSDDEAEEMPPECKMRMRNIGRDTPTSSGPNSFGKTKQGFIDSKKLFEKSLREAASE